MKELRNNIRTLRQKNDWSQEDVANRLQISIPAFSKIETGVTDINLSRLKQIAAVFQISVVDLLTLHEQHRQLSRNKLDVLNEKLLARDSLVADLQKKVIELFEELRSSRSSS